MNRESLDRVSWASTTPWKAEILRAKNNLCMRKISEKKSWSGLVVKTGQIKQVSKNIYFYKYKEMWLSIAKIMRNFILMQNT